MPQDGMLAAAILLALADVSRWQQLQVTKPVSTVTMDFQAAVGCRHLAIHLQSAGNLKANGGQL
ncbi:Hypothetical predicted protein, partial [Marmota monax]